MYYKAVLFVLTDVTDVTYRCYKISKAESEGRKR